MTWGISLPPELSFPSCITEHLGLVFGLYQKIYFQVPHFWVPCVPLGSFQRTLGFQEVLLCIDKQLPSATCFCKSLIITREMFFSTQNLSFEHSEKLKSGWTAFLWQHTLYLPPHSFWSVIVGSADSCTSLSLVVYLWMPHLVPTVDRLGNYTVKV